MGLLILIAMIGIPFAEIAVFIEVGQKIGLGVTLVIVIATAFMGTALLRHQGFSVLTKAQTSLRENRFPLNELFDGLCLLFAGALLLTPGFVTDSLGFLLFVPPFRSLVRAWATKSLARRGHFSATSSASPDGPMGEAGPTIINGDFTDITSNGQPDAPNSDRRPELPPK